MDATFGRPPSTARRARQSLADIEAWLEAERHQLPLWVPVALGSGIAAWFVIPVREGWIAFLCATLAVAAGALALLPASGRLRKVLMAAGMLAAAGCALVWARAEWLAHPVVPRPMVAVLNGRVVSSQSQPALERVRLVVEDRQLGRVRLTVKAGPGGSLPVIRAGAEVEVRARIIPPPPPLLPGGYDTARAAWFQGIAGMATALGPVTIRDAGDGPLLSETRARTARHIEARLAGTGAGGIASALVTGERGAIAKADEDAMRDAGLTHLLSISGLHITAAVAAVMWLTARALASWPWLALRIPVLAVAAGAGALAGIGYTLFTGAEVPTIRSCVAAVLVALALMIGREPFTLRLVAVGALFVLLIWPEALVGASFQLSFAAIVAIVALLDWGPAHRRLARRPESRGRALARGAAGLIATGLAVEIALAPIALYHFHRQGLYGSLANLVAIPLTTFAIMPATALALALDAVGLGAPAWWLAGKAIGLLQWLAHSVAAAPGGRLLVGDIPDLALGLMVAGGLWVALWRTRVRGAGWVVAGAGLLVALTAPRADMLVSSDARHVAWRTASGDWALLRERAGDFVRDAFGGRAASEAAFGVAESDPAARCSDDSCQIVLSGGAAPLTVLVIRSSHHLPWRALTAACARADVVIAPRRLPKGCAPRWFAADPDRLASAGGLAISAASRRVETARSPGADHPWVRPTAADQ